MAKEEKSVEQDAGDSTAIVEEMRDQVIGKINGLVSSVEERIRFQAERDVYRDLFEKERARK